MTEDIKGMLTPGELESAGQKCTEYLVNNIRDDGSFVYEQNCRTGFVSPEYNILRHAGTIYAMCEWQIMYKNTKTLRSVEKTIDYLKKHILPLQEHLLCVSENFEVKLGGAALSLLALIEYHKLRPVAGNLTVMQGLARFICWMQDGSGRFRNKLGRKDSSGGVWETSYYPGQSILGLTRLYLIDNDLTWLMAAEHGASCLIKKYREEHPVLRPYNHWLCMAIAELYPILPDECLYKEYWLLANTVIDLVQKMTKACTSAAMATRGEALAAGLLLEQRLGNHAAAAAIAPIVDDTLQYCLNLQVKDVLANNRFLGGIMQGCHNYNIRIDFVQHTLSVIRDLLQYHLQSPEWLTSSRLSIVAAKAG